MEEQSAMSSEDDNAVKQSLEIHICVPELAYSAAPELSTALAQAIASEVKAAAADLAEYRITRLVVRNATNLSDKDIETVFSALRKSADLTDAYRIVEVAPELINTGLMTSLRNFYIDLYRFDIGSLNFAEFQNLSRKYDFKMYGNLKMMFDNYGMHNWSAELEMGMPRQTEHTVANGLERLAEFAPDVVRLTPHAVGDDEAVIDNLCARWVQTDEVLMAQGYERINIFEYAKPGYERGLDTYTGSPSDYWGFGPGAVSLMDGCAVKNVMNNNRYMNACAQESSRGPVASVVRLDEPSLARNQARYSLCNLAGIDLPVFEASYGSGLNAFFTSLCDRGLATGSDRRVMLTTKGIALSPRVWDELAVA